MPEVVTLLMPHSKVLCLVGMMALHIWPFREYLRLTAAVPSFIF